MLARHMLPKEYHLENVSNNMDLKKAPLTTTQQMVSAGSGSLLVSLFMTPFDVVKVRLQAQLKPNRVRCTIWKEVVETVCYCPGAQQNVNSPVMCVIHGNMRTVPRFNSTIDAFSKIARFEGIGQLWKGLSPTLVMMVPQTVIYFTVYDKLKWRLGLVEGQKNLTAPLVAGVSARTFAVACISPIEMVRTKLQSKRNFRYSQLFNVVGNAIKQEGFLSLWRGMGPTLLRDVPFSAFYWVSYEYLKAQRVNPTFAETFAAGASAGLVAALCTTPFDVIKTHRQMELGELSAGASKQMQPTFKLILILWKTQGFTSLYTGLAARLSKVVPACAIMISCYEYGKKYFSQKNMQDSNSRTVSLGT